MITRISLRFAPLSNLLIYIKLLTNCYALCDWFDTNFKLDVNGQFDSMSRYEHSRALGAPGLFWQFIKFVLLR